MLAIFATLLPVLVRLIGKILDWADADAATRLAFAAFVDNAQRQGLVPLKLKQSYDDQLARLRAQLDAEDAKKSAEGKQV